MQLFLRLKLALYGFHDGGFVRSYIQGLSQVYEQARLVLLNPLLDHLILVEKRDELAPITDT